MSNSSTGQKLHNAHGHAMQRTVEEAYLDDLLHPISNSELQISDVLLDMQDNNAQSLTSEEEQVDNEAEVRVDTTDNNQASINQDIPFACQLIVLDGLKLAVPLSAFKQVIPWSGELIKLAEPRPWIKGQMRNGQQLLDIVDLSALMHNRQTQPDIDNQNDKFKSVLLLLGQTICLPCEDVFEIVTVEPDSVCWRSSNSQRLWLAGTVKQEGYAILDIDGIIQLLT